MVIGGPEERPALSTRLSGHELRRWYWTVAELQQLARQLGVFASGPKLALLVRVARVLDGEQAPAAAGRPCSRDDIGDELTLQTVIPPGQRCTQSLRAFFVEQVGPGFRFDAHMRTFISTGGATLGSAVEHWRSTRSTRSAEAPRRPPSLRSSSTTASSASGTATIPAGRRPTPVPRGSPIVVARVSRRSRRPPEPVQAPPASPTCTVRA